MSTKTWALRWLFLAGTVFSAAGLSGAVGCGLDDTVGVIDLVDASADVTTFDSGSQDASHLDASGDGGGSACASNPCANGGTCTNSGSGFSCTCASGYSGTTCATQINECATDAGNPCLNGGTCTSETNNYSCSCPSGFGGTNCENNINSCGSNPCAHGTCVNGVNTYTCTCTTGFQGANCDSCVTPNYYNYPMCTFCSAAVSCGGNGICSTTGACTCNPGFAGNACQYSDAVTCSGHGTAQSTGSCNCATGFSGATCNTCASSYYAYPTCTFCDPTLTCGGHGTCSTTGTCMCNSPYSGSACGTFSGTYNGSAAMPSGGGSSDTVAQYGQVNGNAAFSTVTTDNRMSPPVATTLTQITLSVASGDIGSRTWTGTIMKNGTATALTCQIAANQTSCNFSANVSVATTDAVNIKVVQSSATGSNRTADWTINYTQP